MTDAPGLRRLQGAFAHAVFGGDPAGLVPELDGDAQSAERQVALYRHAVLASLVGALRATFPVVARLVGEAYFDEAAARHAEASPSASGDLNRFGGEFASFLAAYPHAADLPWLADVARLEWAWHESLSAADAEGLDHAALARVAADRQPGLRFLLHPAVRLVRSDWPILSLWEANQPDRDGTPARLEGADDVLVWREAGRVRLSRVAAAEAAFVEGLARGLTLEEAVGAGDWDLAAFLRRLAGHGMLCGFRA